MLRQPTEKEREAAAKAANMPVGYLLFVFSIFVLGCWGLYRWYSTGTLELCGRIVPCHYVSHQNAPAQFDFAAAIYVACFVFGAVGFVVGVYFKLTKRKWN